MTNKAILQRIRLFRLKKRYSQEYMAARMSISQNAYSKLERGITSITLERIGLIADIFGVHIRDLVPCGSSPDEEN